VPDSQTAGVDGTYTITFPMPSAAAPGETYKVVPHAPACALRCTSGTANAAGKSSATPEVLRGEVVAARGRCNMPSCGFGRHRYACRKNLPAALNWPLSHGNVHVGEWGTIL